MSVRVHSRDSIETLIEIVVCSTMKMLLLLNHDVLLLIQRYFACLLLMTLISHNKVMRSIVATCLYFLLHLLIKVETAHHWDFLLSPLTTVASSSPTLRLHTSRRSIMNHHETNVIKWCWANRSINLPSPVGHTTWYNVLLAVATLNVLPTSLSSKQA